MALTLQNNKAYQVIIIPIFVERETESPRADEIWRGHVVGGQAEGPGRQICRNLVLPFPSHCNSYRYLLM
jgi:hypothetical protein